MTDPRNTDPRQQDPQFSDRAWQRDGRIDSTWSWIAGIALLVLVAFIAIAGWGINTNTARNAPAAVTDSASTTMNPPPATIGSAATTMPPPASTTGQGGSAPMAPAPKPHTPASSTK